ncbi:MAG TPA: thioredoxin-dependent thiol peroxidase [Candidatus Binataceae bacterium]|nr:thioredoxin-dependent thiol peroxidase [Candidatus Binataceae bacterium]
MPAKKSANSAKSKPPSKDAEAAHSLEGAKAPQFEMPDAAGKKVALRDLVGKKNLVIYFYPKDMTPGCTTEACSFRDNLDGIRRLGAQIIGISGDSSASHQKFIDKHALNFPLLSDVGNEVGKRYGVYKMKSLYGRQYMGYERTTMVIDRSGVIRRVFPKVKVNGHTAEVIAALKEIGAS